MYIHIHPHIIKYFSFLVAAFRYHVEPPGLIKLENELELEEEAPLPPPSLESSTPRLPPSPPVSPAPSSSPSPTPTKVAPSKKSTGKLLDDAVRCGSG